MHYPLARLKFAVWVGLGLALPVACFALEANTPLPDLSHKATRLSKPFAAKNFTLKDVDGKTRPLSEFAGKVLIVNFWASWCPPCRREMPSMERIYQQLKGQPFMVLGIDQYEKEDRVFAFMGELDPQPTFPILLDMEGTVSQAWGVKALPTSFIVDKHGMVVFRGIGGRDFEHPEMQKLITDLIQEK